MLPRKDSSQMPSGSSVAMSLPAGNRPARRPFSRVWPSSLISATKNPLIAIEKAPGPVRNTKVAPVSTGSTTRPLLMYASLFQTSGRSRSPATKLDGSTKKWSSPSQAGSGASATAPGNISVAPPGPPHSTAETSSSDVPSTAESTDTSTFASLGVPFQSRSRSNTVP